jgi:hypothetical protein
MEHSRLLPLALLSVAVLSGCQDMPTTGNGKDRTPKKADATLTPRDPDRARREASRKRMQKTLDELDRQYDQFKAKAKEARGEARDAMHKKLGELDARRARARKKLRELKGDSNYAWKEVKKGMDKAVLDLKEAFDKAKDNFR